MTQILEGAFNMLSYLFRSYSKPSKNVDAILLIEPFQLGDVVSLSVLFQPLKLMFPNAKIFLFVKKGNEKMFEHDSRVSKILTSEFPWSEYGSKKGSLIRWWSLLIEIVKLRKYKFDIGIDTRGDIRSQIVMILAGCRKKLGHTSYMGSNILLRGLLLDIPILPPNKVLHRYDWNISSLQGLDLFKPEYKNISFPTLQTVDKHRIINKQYILIHIGGGWKYKRWENDNWISLINELKKLYMDFEIVVISGPNEVKELEYIKLKISHHKSIVFMVTNFDEMINLIKNTSLFIGLDSGPMNIAVCFNKLTIALFGPGDSEMWYPYNNPNSYVHKLDFPCIPCFQTMCGYAPKNCMAHIMLKDVIELLPPFIEPFGLNAKK